MSATAEPRNVFSVSELAEKGRAVVKLEGRQIALFLNGDRVYAVNNRCPHEGYPLIEGTISERAGEEGPNSCLLTCNWHNWKFDLDTKDTLGDRDQLRHYPVEIRGNEIWVDIADRPADERVIEATKNFRDAFANHDYDRMAREVGRLQRAGAKPTDAIRVALDASQQQFEYGATHAHAVTPDWLAVGRLTCEGADSCGDDSSAAESLVPILESVGHLSWDSLRRPHFPFPNAMAEYEPSLLVQALEAEDETAAIAQVRGALAAGLGYEALEPAFAAAALAHYHSFGHSAIWVYKMAQLCEALGEPAESVLFPLTRSLVHAYREEKVPEFRGYTDALAAWDGRGSRSVSIEDFAGLSVKQALSVSLEASGDPEALFEALLGAAAWNMLHFDLEQQERTGGSISQNVGWLDFTHAVTFANAVRYVCSRYPELWPQGLLQIACFVGRNRTAVDPDQDVGEWTVNDRGTFFAESLRSLLDHGYTEYIYSAHLVKLLVAVKEEAERKGPATALLLAATNRFFHSPIKRKHVVRTARQAMSFVSNE